MLQKFLETRPLRSDTQRNYRFAINRHFNDWLDLPITSITKDMVEEQPVSSQKATENINFHSVIFWWHYLKDAIYLENTLIGYFSPVNSKANITDAFLVLLELVGSEKRRWKPYEDSEVTEVIQLPIPLNDIEIL